MSGQDKTGRKRLLPNLLARWMVEAVVVISGFVIPRLIDTHLGQVQLGVWDFGWTVVSYCRFLGFGMAGGLNRFVALNVASNNKAALRGALSTTVAIQLFVAVVTIFVVGIVATSVGSILPDIGTEQRVSAQWCIGFLGGTVAIRMVAWPARGVLTGQHRWAVNSFVTLTGDVLALSAMIVVLILSPSLESLSLSYMLVTGATETFRYFVARRSHDEALFHAESVSWSSFRELFIFGLKSNLIGLSSIIVVQSVSIAIAVSGGAASLAVFSRALALQRHSQVLVHSFAELLTSTAASLQGLGKKRETRRLFLEAMKVSWALTIPIFQFLAFVGDRLILVWMGSDYVSPGVVYILCIGAIVPVAQSAAIRILVGMNQHGRVALAALGNSVFLMMVCGTAAILVGWTPLIGAVVLSTCMTLGYGRVIALNSSRIFDVRFPEYFSNVLKAPFAVNVGLFLLLLFGDAIGMRESLTRTIVWTALCAVLTAIAYWYGVLSLSNRDRIRTALVFPQLGHRGG